ncbi:MAG: glycosyl hydrolase [Armatimonadota bacterium]|nr:glycosyl hydrolase [Armatimonadota bacterium]
MRSDKLNDLSREITGPVPFWFLNAPITRAEVASELDMFLRRGVREIVVHPRYGLDVDYPGDSWFELFRWCLEEARERGMFLWVYDELNWPSGTAGMTVQTRNPEFAGQYLAVSLREEDAGPPELASGRLLIAARIQGGKITKTSWIRDREALGDLGPDWRFFECEVRRDRFYIDTLSRAAVDAFKDSTYEEYYRRFGDEFGKTIRAVFTDEPSIYWVSVGYDDWTLPYTDALFPAFAERYGYQAQPLIPYLFHSGRESSAFRADFWEHVSRLFNDSYHGNLGGWCRDHGIIYTGHSHHEEPVRYQIRFAGDMTGAMRQMDVPGVDHLGKATLGNHWISIIGHKVASSAAHHEGKERVMSESFGLTDWDTTFLDLKKIVDWQFSLGVNLLVPHAFYHSIAGPRKRESPPSFFHQSPHWEDFDAFSAYVARLSETLTGGRHVCRILIVYPLTSLWAAYQPDHRTQEMDYIENLLNSLCLELMKFHLDFDFVSYDTLETAPTSGGRISIAGEEYDALIVLPSYHMRAKEQQTVLRLAQEGVVTCALYRSVEPLEANRPSHPRITLVPTGDLSSMVVQLAGLFENDLHISGRGHEDVMLLRREKDGQQICFLANRADSHRRLLLTLPGRPRLAACSPEDGKPVRLPTHRRDGRTEAVISLDAHESVILTVGADTRIPLEAHAPEPDMKTLPAPDLKVSLPFNAALLSNFAFKHVDGHARQVDVREEPVFIPVNWDPNPPDFSAGAGEYTAAIDVEAPVAGLRIVLDGEYADHELYVNGRPASLRKATPHLLDWGDLEPEEGGLLVQGRNEFRVVTKYKLSEPLRIVGEFLVEQTKEGLRLVKGSPEQHKYELESVFPFYSGTVTYAGTLQIAKRPRRLVLDLGDVRDAAAVYVNGQLAGKRLWPPYRIDVPDFVRLGDNELKIEVRNNLANMLLGRPRPFGLRKPPTLELEE